MLERIPLTILLAENRLKSLVVSELQFVHAA